MATDVSSHPRFYDISDLPDQDIDDHTTKMAQLITNVYVMMINSLSLFLAYNE